VPPFSLPHAGPIGDGGETLNRAAATSPNLLSPSCRPWRRPPARLSGCATPVMGRWGAALRPPCAAAGRKVAGWMVSIRGSGAGPPSFAPLSGLALLPPGSAGWWLGDARRRPCGDHGCRASSTWRWVAGAGDAVCALRPCGRQRGGRRRPGAEVASSSLRLQIWTVVGPPCGAPPTSLASNSLRWFGVVGRR
jgi:hypothetical protein